MSQLGSPRCQVTQLRSPAGPLAPPAPPAGFHVSAAETPVPVSFQIHVLTLSLKIKNTNIQLDSLQSARSLGFPASLVSKYW